MVGREASQPRQVPESDFVAVTGSEPSWRLVEECGTDSKKTSRDELDRKSNNPLLVRLGNVQVDTVVDEETNDGSDLPTELVETNETTSDSRRRDFGDVDGLVAMLGSIWKTGTVLSACQKTHCQV